MRTLLALSLSFFLAGIAIADDQTALASDAKTKAITAKMDSIVLPDIEFKDTKLREALEIVHRQAIASDLAESDPNKRSVNIVLKLDPEQAAKQTVTLSLKKPTLGEAIAAIAAQANLKVKPESYAIALVPNS